METTARENTPPRRRRSLTGAPVLAALLLVGCGGQDSYRNSPRPPAPIVVSGSISPREISISPARFGAGPVVLVVTNQSARSQEVSIVDENLGTGRRGIKPPSTGPINPQGTGQVKVDLHRGAYSIRVGKGIRPAQIMVGARRSSAQNRVLEP